MIYGTIKKDYERHGYDYLLWIHVIKVVLYKLDTCCKVCLVELIWNIPAKRPKLAPLLNHGVQECYSIQERRPLWLRWVVHSVLQLKHIWQFCVNSHNKKHCTSFLNLVCLLCILLWKLGSNSLSVIKVLNLTFLIMWEIRLKQDRNAQKISENIGSCTDLKWVLPECNFTPFVLHTLG